MTQEELNEELKRKTIIEQAESKRITYCAPNGQAVQADFLFARYKDLK